MASHGERLARLVELRLGCIFGGARTGKEISWRGPEAGRSGNHDRVHDPLSNKKANVNSVSFSHFLIFLPAIRLLYSMPAITGD